MKRIYLVPAAALLASLCILGWRKHQEPIPIRTTGDGIPDAAQAGDVPAAMAQCRQVMSILQQNNWDIPNPCPDAIFKLLTLADGKYSESQYDRKPRYANIGIPTKDPETALYSQVYARQNRSYYKGDLSMARPSGFYIVGYKRTGEVRQVPVEQVRIKAHMKAGEDLLCYPDQSCYPTSEPHPSYTRTNHPQ